MDEKFYIWNINALKEQLKKGLSESLKFKYLVSNAILFQFLLVIIGYMDRNNINKWDYFIDIFDTIFVILGAYLVYKANGGDKGINFLERFLSIGFILFLRVFLFVMTIYIIIGIFLSIYGIEIPDSTTVYDLISDIVVSTLFYTLFIKHIKGI